MATLSGSVERIVFRNPDSGFCVARFQQSDVRSAGLTTIVGTLPSVRPGEMLRLDGDWEVHPIHGRNFRVERYEEEMPSTLDGIERYLASGVIRGVGPVTASRIVEEFGERAITVIDEEPELLRRVPGVSANDSTRALKSSHDSSRLRYRTSSVAWIPSIRVSRCAATVPGYGRRSRVCRGVPVTARDNSTPC